MEDMFNGYTYLYLRRPLEYRLSFPQKHNLRHICYKLIGRKEKYKNITKLCLHFSLSAWNTISLLEAFSFSYALVEEVLTARDHSFPFGEPSQYLVLIFPVKIANVFK